jgi:O-succinylbenzoic acid--CoA ligase
MYSDFEQFVKDWKSQDFQFVINTSGSTGAPKPFNLDRDKLIYSANLTREFIKGINKQKVLCCLPTDRMGGFMQLVRAAVWEVEATIVQPSINPMLNILLDHRYENISLSPLQLNAISDDRESWEKLMRFGTILIGGASCNNRLVEKIKRTGHTGFYLTYGMSETYSHIALRNIPNGYFQVLGDIQVRINEATELEICSVLTSNKWMNTRDIAEIHKGKQLLIKGRKDNLINTGGVKFHAEKLEELIKPLMEDSFFIMGLEDDKYGFAITLVTASTKYDLDKLNLTLKENFGAFAQIKKVVQQPIEFNDISGKVKRVIA